MPTFLKREQIHVGDKALVDHLDAYSAPRLVEYFDDEPVPTATAMPTMAAMPMAAAAPATDGRQDAARGASASPSRRKYTVGEYDILILSAQQSTGLETWLRENGYRIPAGASAVLASYLKQNMRFFVARVNLTEQTKLGFSYLRPLQVAYESPKFMLPIRLGMVNANGPQELFVYALTRKGRVETTNYRTVKLPSDMELPVYLEGPGEFAQFYKAMFARQVREAGRARGVPRVRVGHGVVRSRVRPIRCRATSCGSWACSGRTSGAAAAAERVPHPAARPLRQRALPRGSRVPGNRRPHQLPGPLRPAPCVDAARRPAARRPDYRRSVARSGAKQEAQRLASLTGWSCRTSARGWGSTSRRPGAGRRGGSGMWKK